MFKHYVIKFHIQTGYLSEFMGIAGPSIQLMLWPRTVIVFRVP